MALVLFLSLILLEQPRVLALVEAKPIAIIKVKTLWHGFKRTSVPIFTYISSLLSSMVNFTVIPLYRESKLSVSTLSAMV